MQSKHTIMSLTGLILTTSMSGVYAENIKNSMNITPWHQEGQSLYAGQQGEGGEGGESGEGGFDADSLKTDDVAFGTALKVIQAHYAIGQKLYAEGDYETAESFFGHPISEVLVELQTAFDFRHIESPEDEMYALLEIAQEPNKLDALKAGIQKVQVKIDAAFKKMEVADTEQQTENIGNINAELIRRSKLEYFVALDNNDIDHLQDSIGYFEVAYDLFQANKVAYNRLNADKTTALAALFTEIKPFFKDFHEIDDTANHKKLAGLCAKIELGLANLK
jgi:hypothetical protein